MKLSDSIELNAPREKVWQALNDPDVLKQCIPGCETITKAGDNAFEAVATAKVGPVKAKFKGEVTLSDLDPPNSYTISGQGSGGAAGFAKGGAHVTLSEPAPGKTTLSYDVDAQVGGKLAQIGQRLVDVAAKKMAGDFFEKFAAVVNAGEPEEAAPAPAEETASEVTEIVQSEQSRSRLLMYFGLIVLAGIVLWLLTSN